MSPALSLSLFWFLQMGGLGIFFPFFALYLRENAGLTGTEAGLVYAMIPAVSLAAPALWGRIADRASSPARVLGLITAGTAFGHVTLGLLDGFVPLLAGTALLAAFGTAVIPLGVSVSLSALGDEGHYSFGRVRVWGTVGFLALVSLFPFLLDLGQWLFDLRKAPGGPSEPGLRLMFFAAAAFTLLAAAVTRRIPAAAAADGGETQANAAELGAHVAFVRMLLYGFAAYLCLQGPMNFFPTWVQSRGGGLDDVSRMWILMLLPEIPLVALSGTGLRRFGARGLLAGALVAGGLRWIVSAASHELWIIYPVQLLHGVTVAGLLIGGPLYVDLVVPARLRSTAQGLLAAAGVGVGGVTSSVATGWLMDALGTDAPYALGGAGAVVLGLLTWVILPAPRRPV